MGELRLDRTSLDALVLRAEGLLRRVREREAFHTRALAERMVSSWHASSMTLDELAAGDERSATDPECERVRIVLQARAEALRSLLSSELPARARLDDLLRAERLRAQRALDEVVAAGAQPDAHGRHDGIRSALLVLAGQIATMLELRILAERFGDPERSDLLDAERDRWIGVARALVANVIDSRGARPGERRSTRLRPLAGRVVLSVARAPAVLGRLAVTFEEAGATTVLADSHESALSLMRWFQIDAALCVLDRSDDPLLVLPAETRRARADRGHLPLFVALLPLRSRVSPEVTASSGFDAAIPIALADPSGLSVMLGLAMQARRRSRQTS